MGLGGGVRTIEEDIALDGKWTVYNEVLIVDSGVKYRGQQGLSPQDFPEVV